MTRCPGSLLPPTGVTRVLMDWLGVTIVTSKCTHCQRRVLVRDGLLILHRGRMEER